MAETTEKKRPKNWLLIKIREWHTWMGIALSAVIVMVCFTGIYLNHKDLFRGEEYKKEMAKEGGKPGKPHEMAAATPLEPKAVAATFTQAIASVRDRLANVSLERLELESHGGQWIAKAKPSELRWDAGEVKFAAVADHGHGHEHEEHGEFTLADLDAAKIKPEPAVIAALESLGKDAAIEKIEVKHEKGHLQYKVKAYGGGEATVLADSETLVVLGKYEEPARAGMVGQEAKGGYNWGKIMKDLHTGKLGGEAGKLLIDFTSFVIMVLTISGIYLWYVPRKRKKEAAAAAQAVIKAKAAAAAAPVAAT